VSIVVGLGNPGDRYALTRHNIGFMALDRLAQRRQRPWSSFGAAKTESMIASADVDGNQVLLVKPQTFMNASGKAVMALHARQPFEPSNLLVVLDDFHLAFGRLRLRRSGSDGGHNGLGSVIDKVGSEDIPRLRMGIGPLPDEGDDIDYVLSDFRRDENVDELVGRGCSAVEHCIADGIYNTMNQFNGCAPL
tara:strand:+ start:66 stop:641 length:576 start_codon:yes stop_codon:yes gene_type:complete